MQDLMYNFYMFRAAISFFYIPGVFLFTETNITDFFKRFKNIATNCELSDDRKIQRVQKYYEFDITQRIQDLDSYEEKDWKRLIKKIKTIYKNRDINQQRYTRAYLTTLTHKARGEKEINLYNRQFRSIAKEFIKKKLLNENSTVRLYISGLSRYITRKLLSDSEFEFNNNYSNINIKKLTDKAINITKIK